MNRAPPGVTLNFPRTLNRHVKRAEQPKYGSLIAKAKGRGLDPGSPESGLVLRVAVSAALAPWISPYDAGECRKDGCWRRRVGALDGYRRVGGICLHEFLRRARYQCPSVSARIIALIIGTAWILWGFKGGRLDRVGWRVDASRMPDMLIFICCRFVDQYRRILVALGCLLGALRSHPRGRSCKRRKFYSSKAPGRWRIEGRSCCANLRHYGPDYRHLSYDFHATSRRIHSQLSPRTTIPIATGAQLGNVAQEAGAPCAPIPGILLSAAALLAKSSLHLGHELAIDWIPNPSSQRSGR